MKRRDFFPSIVVGILGIFGLFRFRNRCKKCRGGKCYAKYKPLNKNGDKEGSWHLKLPQGMVLFKAENYDEKAGIWHGEIV